MNKSITITKDNYLSEFFVIKEEEKEGVVYTVLSRKDGVKTVNFDELTDVTIDEGVDIIEVSLFSGCNNLKSITFGPNVKRIRNMAFKDCADLKCVTFIHGLTTDDVSVSIDSSCFNRCPALEEVYLSEKVKQIDGRAFANCKNLVIHFLSCPKIADTAFEYCDSVRLSVPYGCGDSTCFNNLGEIEDNKLFVGKDHILYRVLEDDESVSVDEDNHALQSETIYIPETITYNEKRFRVISIDANAFRENSYVTEFVLPINNLSEIGKGAFAFCPNLGSIRFHDNGMNDNFLIEGKVLYKREREGLCLLVYPPKVSNAVLTLSKELKSIADYAFSNVCNLKRIKFTQTEPVEIESEAFTGAKLEGCYAFLDEGLYNSKFKDTLEKYLRVQKDDNTFTFNNNVYSIIAASDYKEAALVKWKDEKKEVIDESVPFAGVNYSVVKILDGAFRSNTEITNLSITKAVREIEGNPFADCTKLTEITVGKDNERFTTENGVLLEKTGKKERKLIAYPAGRNVKDYGIPENIVSIGENAFKNCSLTQIVIPKDDMITMDGKSGLPDKLDVVLPSVSAYKIYSKSSWNNYHLVLPDYEHEGIKYHLNIDKNKRTAEIVDAKAGLKEVTIPVTVKFGDDDFKIEKICSGAFKKCTSLTKITCDSEIPVALEKDVFNKKMTVYVPSKCYVFYNSATNWNVHTIFDGEKPDKFTVGKIIYSKMNDSEVSIQSVSGVETKDQLIIEPTVCYHNYTFNVVAIMDGAFEGINCASITIPDTVISIENNPFKGCSGNVKIKIDKDGSFKENNGLFVKDNTLVFCQPKCRDIIIPENINITRIGTNAFASCPDLKSINLESLMNVEPPTFEGQPGCKKTIQVVVPFGKIAAYRKTEWNDYFDLKQLYVLSLEKESLTLIEKDTEIVNITSGNDNYSVENSNPSVVTSSLSKNTIVVKSIQAGNAIITITDTRTSQIATISIKVISPLALAQNSVSLMVNASGTVSITSGNGNYSVVSNNSAIATASLSGSSISISGRKAGSATITVTDKQSSKTATISVTVMKNLTLSSSSLPLMVNASGTVSITSGNGNYSVVSNNSAIATASLSGSSISISGRKAGSATITVTDKQSSKTATISVTVMKNLTLSYSSLSMVIHTNKTVNILSGNGRYSVTTNNRSIVSASITGNSIIVHALNPGNSIITVTDTITSQTAKISVTSIVGVSDNLQYNPNALQVIAEKDGKYLLTDGRSRMVMFANREDAYNGMHIAMRHNLHCFIGRSNKRAERMDYIFEFWAGTSGLTNQPLTKTDLISYNPNNLTAVSMGSSGWSIRDGNHWMFIADNEADAKAIISILKNYTKVGYIGRDNKQPDRKNYIMTYLE
ncbi:MAG: leucine-rich repeat protein [Segatella oris]|uniref:leucine-rich repeat protein n=1 Tax=Segatella oris TaxID=28135 RepID=UPI003FA32800